MNDWTKIPSDEQINETIASLQKNGIEAFVVENGEEAYKKFFELVPVGAEVMTNASITLVQLGITKEINESGKYRSVKQKLSKMDSATQGIEKRRVGSAFEYGVGSAHAITRDGHVMMTSGSGSQIPGYAYGAQHVVWVIGAQKLVENVEEGLRRIYEHSWPLENDRLKDHGGSNPRRILIFNSENEQNKDRTKAIILKESIGY